MADTLTIAPQRESGDICPKIPKSSDLQGDEFHPLLPADFLPRSAAGKEKKANRSGRRTCQPPPKSQSYGNGPRRDDDAGGNGSGDTGRQGQGGAGGRGGNGGGTLDHQDCNISVTEPTTPQQRRPVLSPIERWIKEPPKKDPWSSFTASR